MTIKIEGSAEDLTHLFDRLLSSVIQHLSSGTPCIGTPVASVRETNELLGEDAWKIYPNDEPTKAETFWGSPVPSSEPEGQVYQEKVLRERAESGGVVWYHLVTTWAQNFGESGKQPDRAKLLTDAMNDGGSDMIFYVRQQGGLTRCVRSVAPNLSKAQSRLIAENIASVSSALGIPLHDFLEYDKETRDIKGN
jgi:hypothetical protein